MKIHAIQATNFLGARAVDVKLSKPVALFAGKNGAGKSSLQEAIRMAMTGESVRVDLKKDYGQLVSEGQDSGFVTVTWANGEASIVLPKGDRHLAGSEQIHGALPYVLDAQRFAGLDDKSRRAFLFALMGLKTDGPAVTQRLIERGCDAAKVDQVAPMLRAGFDAAHKEAQAKAREAKASWKTVTGGETYGEKKAEGWKAEAPVVDPAALAAAEKALAEIDAALEAANRHLGGLQSAAAGVAGRAARIAELQEKAGKRARIQEKLHRDEEELATWEQKVAETRAKAGTAPKKELTGDTLILRGLASVTYEFLNLTMEYSNIVWDANLLNRAAMHLADYEKVHGSVANADQAEPDPEAVAALPSHEKALSLLQSAVANGKRDLAAADTAAEMLKQLEQEHNDAPSEGAILESKSKVETLKNDRKGAQTRLDDLRAAMRRSAEADSKTKAAASHHADVLAWDAIAAALAPDGIPGEILAEALDPINERLRSNAILAEWEPAQINSDMTITYGLRDYNLVSESEKWRADAMIAESVSFLSGIKLLVLDRFDVLDMKGREDLLYWLDGMAEDGDIDTALIFGTLKALPAQLLPNIEGHWLENGTAGQMKEAA